MRLETYVSILLKDRHTKKTTVGIWCHNALLSTSSQLEGLNTILAHRGWRNALLRVALGNIVGEAPRMEARRVVDCSARR